MAWFATAETAIGAWIDSPCFLYCLETMAELTQVGPVGFHRHVMTTIDVDFMISIQ